MSGKYLFKCIVLGDFGVGKSTFIKNVAAALFSGGSAMSTGVDFFQTSVSTSELVRLCDLIFLLAIKPLPYNTLPVEDQTFVDACPVLFQHDAENRVTGSPDARQIIEEYRNCQRLNTQLKEYCGNQVRIRIKPGNKTE